MEKNKEKKHSKVIKIIIAIIIIIAAIISYGFFIEPKLISVHEYKITIENLPDNFDGFKIVHISDLHCSDNFDKTSLEKLVDSINEQEPDIVVLTGDLLDKNLNITTTIANEISELLNNITATSGKYAIKGDEDLNFDEWSNIITNGGFIDLNGTYDTIYKDGYDSLFISGASSLSDEVNITEKLNTAINYLNSFETDGPIYKILLIHEPDVIDDMSSNPFDLILAGHSLAGQVRLPFIGGLFFQEGAKKYQESYYELENTDLYISNGLGTINYSFRLFNTPSYNVYRLVN